MPGLIAYIFSNNPHSLKCLHRAVHEGDICPPSDILSVAIRNKNFRIANILATAFPYLCNS